MHQRQQNAVAHVYGSHLVFSVQHHTIHDNSAGNKSAPQEEGPADPFIDLGQNVGHCGACPLEIEKNADVQAHVDIIVNVHRP